MLWGIGCRSGGKLGSRGGRGECKIILDLDACTDSVDYSIDGSFLGQLLSLSAGQKHLVAMHMEVLDKVDLVISRMYQ